MAKNRIIFTNDFILSNGNIGIGTTNPTAKLDVNGDVNVSGIATFQNNIRVNGITVGVSTRSSTNIAIGDNALLVDSAGATNDNIAIGNNALRNNTGSFGRTNIAIGGDALKNNSAENNTAIGYRCLENNQGYHNLAVGFFALRDTTTGSENTSVGGNSNIVNISGLQNSSLGHNSLQQNLSGSYNVALGKNALVSNTTGSYNIGVGVYNGISTNKSGNILIGSGVPSYNFDAPKDASNQLAIGRRSGSGAASYWIVGDENYNIGIGTTAPQYKLHVVGDFGATTKSFVIPHPTKPGMTLRHGSLEGPENGVYVRGKTTESVIPLPDYWTGLVDEDTITVNLTPKNRKLHSVVGISSNTVEIECVDGEVDCYFMILGERKDVAKLEVEY